ncbi:MAG: carboxypeptidase-like regulatory domain-containing protein [Terriglobia bacterium]|jgi:hypothetical protein
MRHASRIALLLAVLFMAAPSLLWGQASSTGTITGQIVDQSGGVVVGAEVTITDISTGSYQTQPTSPAGLFTFTNVRVGFYNVTVAAKGFRRLSVPQQQVVVGQQLTLNLTVEVGLTTQTVEVTAAPGAELQTMNSTLGTTLGGSTLLILSNANRDATSLLMFQPTAIPTFGAAEGNVTGGQVAGSMSDQNTFMLDGGNATSDLEGDNNYIASNRGYAGPQAGIPTPVESIEEFKVATSNQTADFSSSAGAEVMMVTKRGTNAFHGSVYDYFQGQMLNAAGWGNNDLYGPAIPKVKAHQNRFGGAIGGPMHPGQFLGGKTFFYANYEGFRYPYANGRFERTVPSDKLRAGILQYHNTSGGISSVDLKTSNQCGESGNLPCDPRGLGIDPTIQTLWTQYMPEPNDCSNYGDHLNTCGYFGALKLNQSQNFGVIRLDHDFGSKWRFMTSYRYFTLVYPSTNQVDIGGLIPGDTKGVLASQSSNPGQPRYWVAGLTGNLTPNVTNEFHINYLRNDWNWIRAGVPVGNLGIPGGLEVGGETTQPLAPMNFDTQDARFRTWNGHDWTYSDTMSWMKGKHFFQMGGSMTHWWDNHVRPDDIVGGLTQMVYQIAKASGLYMTSTWRPPDLPSGSNGTWNSLYAETLGFVGTASQLFVRGGSDLHLTGAPYLQDHSITNQYSLFLTDSFKVKPNLTLNYGIEWGVQMPPYELNGMQMIPVDTQGNIVHYQSLLDNQQNAALRGQVYDPVIGFEPITAVGGHPKYPFQPYWGGFAPRVSVAWNPAFDSGILNKIFGNKKSVFRAGYGRIFDRSNAVNLVMTPLLGYGFGQNIKCSGGRMDGVCTNAVNGTDPTNGFRIGTDGKTAPFPAVSPTLPVPVEWGINSPATGYTFALDGNWRPGRNDEIDVTLQRELRGQMVLEVGYTGRWARHLYLGMNNDGVPYMLTLGGQTFAQAYANLWQADHAGKAAAPQPFFEKALGGGSYCGGYASCTAAVQANEGSSGTGNITNESPWNLVGDLDGTKNAGGAWNFPGCVGCSIMPSNLQSYYGIDWSTTKGFANYQAGFVTLQKRAGHGLMLSANLTWSHALDTDGINQEYVEDSPNDIYNLNTDYAPAPWDRRWVANIVARYNLPFGKGKYFSTSNPVLDRVIGGWSVAPVITIATGRPVESYTGSCQEYGTGAYMPWCAGAVPMVNTGTFGHSPNMAVHTDGSYGVNNDPNYFEGAPGANLFKNPTAVFKSYRPVVLGMDTKTYDDGPFYGQSRWNVDLGIEKDTKVTERVGIQFFVQMLNAFNHMEYNDPSMNLMDQWDWGTLTSQYNAPRVIELGLRIHF